MLQYKVKNQKKKKKEKENANTLKKSWGKRM